MAVVLIANFITMLPFGAILVTVGLMTLAMIYFLSGMVATETGKDPGDNNPGKKAFGFDNFVNMVFAIFMIGALFTIQYWPNASFFINLSLVDLLCWISNTVRNPLTAMRLKILLSIPAIALRAKSLIWKQKD
jgi:hypothetical protein